MPEPETPRQELTIATPRGPVRAIVHVPKGASAARRAAAVVLHRGIPSADEPAGDLMESIAQALAAAGLIALRFDPRAADLILADFNAYAVGDEADDLHAVLNAAAHREEVDAARLSLLSFGLGSIAASIVVPRMSVLDRLCLIAPAEGGYVLSRMLKSNGAGAGAGAAAALRSEQLPAKWVAGLAETDAPSQAAAHAGGTLIVHGAGDRFTSPAASETFEHALEAARQPVERVLVARADHVFSAPATRRACIERVVRFFSEQRAARPPRQPAGAGT